MMRAFALFGRNAYACGQLGASQGLLANDAGALGYVVKSRMITELVPAIREALAGHIFISYHPAGRYH